MQGFFFVLTQVCCLVEGYATRFQFGQKKNNTNQENKHLNLYIITVPSCPLWQHLYSGKLHGNLWVGSSQHVHKVTSTHIQLVVLRPLIGPALETTPLYGTRRKDANIKQQIPRIHGMLPHTEEQLCNKDGTVWRKGCAIPY